MKKRYLIDSNNYFLYEVIPSKLYLSSDYTNVLIVTDSILEGTEQIKFQNTEDLIFGNVFHILDTLSVNDYLKSAKEIEEFIDNLTNRIKNYKGDDKDEHS